MVTFLERVLRMGWRPSVVMSTMLVLLNGCLVTDGTLERWANPDGPKGPGTFQQASDHDGDGYTAPDDCDDQNANVYPGAPEVCDGQDNDCDHEVDEEGAVDAPTWYADGDGDGFGAESGEGHHAVTACEQPEGYAPDGGDCDDYDGTTYPGATEVCDGRDNNCDGDIDEGTESMTTWYPDADGDGFGYGDAEGATQACEQPEGYVADGTDCDDEDATVYPYAPELADGQDNDCDGEIDEGLCTPDDLIWTAEARHASGTADTSFSDEEEVFGGGVVTNPCDNDIEITTASTCLIEYITDYWDTLVEPACGDTITTWVVPGESSIDEMHSLGTLSARSYSLYIYFNYSIAGSYLHTTSFSVYDGDTGDTGDADGDG